ncbi:hypothetical protein KAW50_03895 [candidate division WOR-3 bacterium]|nr:hypothetical protein [candidate division WOR-3 bacterium]
MNLIEHIKNDKESGANELKGIARQGILEFISKSHSKESLFNFLHALELARPSMAPIKVLTRTIIAEVKDLEDPYKIDQKVKEIVNASFIKLDALIKNAEKVLTNKKVILTYSYSSTVLKVFVGVGFKLTPTIFVPEGRPNFEGRKFASRLSSAGLRVVLITDAEVSRFMKDTEIVIIGADRITEISVINKVGTFSIALLAREFKIPCYVVCGRDKFLSKIIAPFEESPKDPKEIWDIEGIEVLNFYFEEVPIKYFTGIITDDKIILPNDVSAYLNSYKI